MVAKDREIYKYSICLESFHSHDNSSSVECPKKKSTEKHVTKNMIYTNLLLKLNVSMNLELSLCLVLLLFILILRILSRITNLQNNKEL